MTEKYIENKLSFELKRIGCLYFKWESPGNRGVPDRIVITPVGKTYFVELKRPKGGRLSALQKYQRERMVSHGAEVRVIRNEEEIAEFVKEIRDATRIT